MKKEEIDFLVEQIRSIILNKPITPQLSETDEEFARLQEAIAYLSDCLSESNQFLKELAKGNLETVPPSRHNFLAGSLKELHSGLKHVTWQADQVANGDYNQTVSFLGDFSASFNKMVGQLSERELKLKEQSNALTESNELMKSIMDGLKDWIIVTSTDTNEVVYCNEAAHKAFHHSETQADYTEKYCIKMDQLLQSADPDIEIKKEYTCPSLGKTFSIDVFPVIWNDMSAHAHYIVDISEEKAHQNQIEQMAYHDELTGLFNRHYFFSQIESSELQNIQYCICIIDLDGLKHANDTFGHSAGDEYLLSVSHALKGVARSTDIVCRLGGDEFAILFQNCKVETAIAKMETVNKQLKESSKAYPMAISFGISNSPAKEKQSVENIIEQADEKMYTQKRKKKNT